MPGQFGFELSPEDIASASDKTQQQVSPSFSSMAGELAPVPWWKRKLRQMQEGNPAQAAGQAAQGGGGNPVDSWESLGKGVGNLARMFIPFEQGGAVQGPTLALVGEGGEPEYVVPESKALPFAMRTMQDGIPPNPASLPRTERRPPPPVILANTPAMCNGGKVIPKMMNGGMVLPNGRPVQAPMEEPTDFFNIGQPMPEPSFAPNIQAPMPASIRPPGLPNRPQIAPSFAERQRLQSLIAQGPPPPKFYDRLFMGEGGGQLDTRAGVAPYSVAGRAAGKIISSLLPYNKKRDEYQRQVEAAKVGVQNEDAQNASNERMAQAARADRVADAQVASSRTTEALRNKQAEALNAPPPPVDPYKDMVEVDEATGRRAGVMPGQDGKFRIPRSSVRIPTEAAPRETPEQATARRNKEADDFIAQGLWEKGSTEDVNYRAGRNVSRPAKTGGAGGASASTQVSLSADEERMAKAVADGTYDPAKVTGKNKNSILARAADLGYSPTPKYSAKEKEDLENLKVLSDAVDKLIGGPNSTTKEATQRQSALRSGVGLWDGTVGAWLDKKVGWGADGEVVNARQLLGIVTGALAKAQGGASFTPTERELMERYTPTQDESDESVIAKLKGLRDFLNTKRSAIESLNAAGPARVPNANRASGSATANAPTPPFPGAVLMQAPNVKDPVWVAPDKVESAIKKGAKRI